MRAENGETPQILGKGSEMNHESKKKMSLTSARFEFDLLAL